MVLLHASANLMAKGICSREQRTCTLEKGNPVRTSNNIFLSLPLPWTERITNSPPNLPLGTPSNALLSAGIKGPHNVKSSKFGNRAIMSQIATALTPFVASMVKEVTDSGNLQSEDNWDPWQCSPPIKDSFRTFANWGACAKNSSGNQ